MVLVWKVKQVCNMVDHRKKEYLILNTTNDDNDYYSTTVYTPETFPIQIDRHTGKERDDWSYLNAKKHGYRCKNTYNASTVSAYAIRHT